MSPLSPEQYTKPREMTTARNWSQVARRGSMTYRDTQKAHAQNTVRVQKCRAKRKGLSSMGSVFVKGQPIFHLASQRSTREVFILTEADLKTLNKFKVQEFNDIRK